MSDFNRVFLIGRIGNDLELKKSAQEKPYLRISLATAAFKSGGEKATYWHRVMVFGHQAEVCAAYLQKGSQIMIEGYLEVRSHSDENGRKNNRVSVIATRVQFMSGRRTFDPAPEPETLLTDSETENAEVAALAS